MDQSYPYANVNINKVYINRNFNRHGPSVLTLSNSNFMYLNPNFSHTSSQPSIAQQRDQATRPKIHVNPNFIKPKSLPQDIVTNSQSVSINSVPTTARPINAAIYQSAYVKARQAINEYPINTQAAPVTNSRYCLVRQKENKSIKSPVTKILPKNDMLQTVKINKYKLVSLNAVKKVLATDKSSTIKASETTSNQKFTKSKYKIRLKTGITSSMQNTRFKFVKNSSKSSVLNSSDPMQSRTRRVSITLNKCVMKTSFRHTKVVKGAMKKNNIPCPLFKKFGKCLRMARGSCDYLHDKKHVSICRKFLKGICHDQQCLLSHDLTDKKMPTCYFYLQGNCTKDECPYLHVKLNEKTKICPDFVKGYCEKGDKCLHRHVNVCLDTASKITRTKKQNSIQIHKRMNSSYSEKTKIYRKGSINKRAPDKVIAVKHCDNESMMEHRYFKDVADEANSAEQCDLIKPTRCKLGTLPSFIQL